MGRVIALPELITLRPAFRSGGKTVVFTNGVFDILHRGHVEYLSRAKQLGDVLIVGMNSDDSVRRVKGKLRPIVAGEDRAFVLSRLDCVDFVCFFTEDTPRRIIDALVPDVLVKGSDWDARDIVGRETVEKAGGRVATIDYVPDRSTTGIIERILERCA
ncbi:MAG TPA: D-glycero-beta-D-manno-heptose 1-phosphate adenylyltransferase [Bacteroidota bacterium]|nr:D-glycero-beta-D-manno-heptose 1-phosphate adenylyltransferase [Bacteroidota bacterium]